MGASFAVDWTGPDARGEYITIVEAGAREGTYLSYVYTRGGSPATLTAPGDADDFEVRYVLGRGDRRLASAPIRVTEVEASLSAPSAVAANAPFEVEWRGPNNSSAYITIVLSGAQESTYLSWAYTSRGSPTTLTAPATPGEYEVRYVLGQGDRTLARASITVR